MKVVKYSPNAKTHVKALRETIVESNGISGTELIIVLATPEELHAPHHHQTNTTVHKQMPHPR